MTSDEDFVMSDDDYCKILNCIKQHMIYCLENDFNFDEFFVISVWYPEMANLYLKSGTKENEFAILNKFDSGYKNKNNVIKAHKIWDANLIPVEILKDNQGYFFCFPKNFGAEDLYIYGLLSAEYDIPKVEDFYA